MEELEGRVSIVTGSGEGIGKEIALSFARAGGSVAVVDKNAPAGRQTAGEIEALGRESLFVECDVSQFAAVRAMVAEVLTRFGKIDVLVNNAGIVTRRSLMDATEEEWRAIQLTNVSGPFFCTRAVAPHMIERRTGSILNVGSGAAAFSRSTGLGIYSVSKSALDQLTLKFSGELEEFGIAVNVFRPGMTLTPGAIRNAEGNDLSGWLQPDRPEKKIGDAAVYLAAHAADPGKFLTGQLFDGPEFGKTWP